MDNTPLEKTYVLGDSVPIKFEVETEKGEPVLPLRVAVSAYSNDGEILKDATAEVEGNRVSYQLPNEIVNQAGQYSVYFEMMLPGGFKKSHSVTFAITPKKVPKAGQGTPAANIGKDEIESIIENAIGSTIRKLRRNPNLEGVADIAYDSARAATGKPLPR